MIDDEIGYRLELIALVDDHPEPVSSQQDIKSTQYTISRYERVLMGLSMPFGIPGVLFWWKGMREERRQDTE